MEDGEFTLKIEDLAEDWEDTGSLSKEDRELIKKNKVIFLTMPAERNDEESWKVSVKPTVKNF